MLTIIFGDGQIANASFNLIRNGVIELIGDNVDNLTGFKAYTENNIFLGDYSDYTTKYNEYTPIEDGIRLSNGEVEPKPIVPVPVTSVKVIFEADENCSLVGETEVIVPKGTKVNKLTFPEVSVKDSSYEFVGWSPEADGKLENNTVFTAISQLKEEFTLEARLTMVEECLMEIADIVYE